MPVTSEAMSKSKSKNKVRVRKRQRCTSWKAGKAKTQKPLTVNNDLYKHINEAGADKTAIEAGKQSKGWIEKMYDRKE